jgi:hypothetical protein
LFVAVDKIELKPHELKKEKKALTFELHFAVRPIASTEDLATLTNDAA